MCKGLAQQLLDLRIIPSASICSNSNFAARSLAGFNLRNFEVTGLPVVMMWCSMPCFEGGNVPLGFTTSGNLLKRGL
jgi:hypothetical protein